VFHEWASACGHTLAIESSAIPVSPDARGICELLGLDPVFLASEGMTVVAVPGGTADRALTACQRIPQHQSARRIGEVHARGLSPVFNQCGLGGEQALDEPIGPVLPRIC
jgi:hydrogenase expression/formation protein HypE